MKPKRLLLFGSLAAIAVIYLSFRNFHNDPPVPAPVSNHGGGQPVPMAQIKPCLAAYKEVMKKYNITTDNPRKPVTKCPDSTYLITLSEAFHADSLVAWLNGQIQEYDPQGKGANLNFVVMPGIATTQLAGSVKKGSMTPGRIAFFIVAQPRTSGKSKLSGDPGSGYEVGGLEP